MLIANAHWVCIPGLGIGSLVALSLLQCRHNQLGVGHAGSAAAGLGSGREEPARAAGRRSRGVEPAQPVGDDAANWERFHLRCNKSARFYKERRRARSQPAWVV